MLLFKNILVLIDLRTDDIDKPVNIGVCVSDSYIETSLSCLSNA